MRAETVALESRSTLNFIYSPKHMGTQTNHQLLREDTSMTRYYVDCRDYPAPTDKKCSVALAADSKEELTEAVVQHGTQVHGYEDTPEFREKIMQQCKEGTPPVEH